MSGKRDKKPPPDRPPTEPQQGRVAYRSAITGRYVDKATAARHPKMTIKETVKRPGRKAGGASKDKLKK